MALLHHHPDRFLATVSCPQNVHDIAPCSLTSYSCGWQRAWETTSSSVSSIHFGHYMASTFNPEILVINAAMADIPFCMGFTYERWKKGLNIMIKKTVGDFNVKKLCIILLFEADFNANNKWIGWAIMYQAEQAHLMAEEHFGSCNSSP